MRDRNEGISILESELETELPQLQDCIKAESHERQQQDAVLMRKVVDESENISKAIIDERRDREAQEEETKAMIESWIETVRQDLIKEKQIRE